MTIDSLKTFYQAVKSLNLTWKVDEHGLLRATNSWNGFACPRIALGCTPVRFSNRFIRNLCPKIYDAADNAPGHDTKVRKALLEACGLSNG